MVERFSKLWLKHKWETLVYCCFCFVFIGIELVVGRGDAFVWANGSNNKWADFLFPFLTYYGDGLTHGIFIALLLLLKKWRETLVASVSLAFYGILSSVLKNWVFPEMDRPYLYLESVRKSLHWVEGVALHGHHSFPSGHTMTCFAISFLASIYFSAERLWVKIGFISLALLGGYSRIYLGQHFFADVGVGGLIGILSVYVAFSTLGVWKKKQEN